MMIDYEKSIKHLEEGKIIKGKIVAITPNDVVVDIGYKSEGIIPKQEFKSQEELKIGNEVEVLLECKENEEGRVVISKEKVDCVRGWERVEKNYKEGDLIKGKVAKKVKGGFMVDILGLEAFLPNSQAALKDIDPDVFVGKEDDFIILKVNRLRKNVILSRRAALAKKKEIERERILNSLEKGKVLNGVVKNISDFGAFVDIGAGVIGLVYIKDMSWGRVSHPSEIVKIGDEVDVVALDFDREKMKVSLGMKQTTPDPWEEIEKKYPVGKKLTGTVVSLLPYGAFVELERGIEGLVHISDFSWTKKYNSPQELLVIGDKVEVVILEIDKENRRVALGIKQLEQNPWLEIEKKYKVGQKIKGKVRNITDYGIFVELEDGIDGLVHVSDMSWTRKITNPKDIYKKGDTVEAVVLSIDAVNRRIALGIKQLTPDPWDDIQRRYAPGTSIKGRVTKITNFGMFVEIEKDLEGLLHISEVELAPGEKLGGKFKVGDEVEVKVIRIEGVQKKIALSMKW